MGSILLHQESLKKRRVRKMSESVCWFRVSIFLDQGEVIQLVMAEDDLNDLEYLINQKINILKDFIDREGNHYSLVLDPKKVTGSYSVLVYG